MKKILIIVTFSFFMNGMSSCSKKLMEEPRSIISPEQFFTSVTECESAVNGVYTPLNNIFGQEDFWEVAEIGNDLTMVVNRSSVNFAYSYSALNAGHASNMWTKLYDGIGNANMVINRVSHAPIDQVNKDRIVGEGKFLRAMYYFLLTNLFGDVPLWTDELDIDKVSILPRTPLAEVRNQMIKDLKEAAAGLPLNYTASNVGRATKGAALSLLAKVYLFNKDYKTAIESAKKVVDDNQYKLLPVYADLYNVQKKNTQESIFEIQFKRDAAANLNYKTTYYYAWFMPLQDAGKPTFAGVNFGSTVIRGYEIFYPSEKLVAMFEAGDKRKDVVLGYSYNGQPFIRKPKNGMPWFGAKFWDVEANDRSSGKNVFFLRYADVILMLAEANNELGNTAEALTYLNMNRRRAGLANLNGISQEEIRQQVMKERAIEFVGEFQRKWDLARWGVLVPAIQSVSASMVAGAKNVQDYKKLYPVPAAEILKNANLLPNNEGY